MCGISDEAETSEMARINIDVHIQVAHPSTRKAVKVQPDPAWNLPALAGEHEDAAGGLADEEDDPGPGT
jgi:hypothetical protein